MVSRYVFVGALITVGGIACSADRGGQTPESANAHTRLSGDTSIGCVQTRGQRPDTTIAIGDTARRSAWQRAYARGAEYRCIVSPFLPAVRAVAFGDGTYGVDSIAITPDTVGARPTQTIALDAEFESPSPHHWDAFRMLDLDADGYADLLIGKSWGATGNTDYGIWMYEPATRRFVVDTSLKTAPFVNVVPGRPCIWTAWHMSARDGSSAMLCRRGGRWITDSVVAQRGKS